MRTYSLLILIACFGWACNASKSLTEEKPDDPIRAKTAKMVAFPGYFPFYYDSTGGKIWLEIRNWEEEFLYINSLSAGIGSNDIGLDRGQIGRNRVVKFIRSGPKVLLVQPNYDYRAESDNANERRAVAEAFAQSVLGGFEVAAEKSGRVLIDFTPFLLQDAHHVSRTLARQKQGTYKLNAKRSALYLERCKNFPDNSEFEAMLTFAGKPDGAWIRSVTPSPEAVTVRQHHSLVRLPDDQYRPRSFDPRSGYMFISYHDYATPIESPLVKRFILRHRLQKRDPLLEMSEAIDPIVYYVDPGAPEPIRSALIEGASWWNQAFEAAGYKNAFQVKILPDGADPMDVRYNLIQWVHRSTRGWSYGRSVIDPRTGEIIKGHVSLGSLRVRQDFLIAQGLLSKPYEAGKEPSLGMKQMALARLRQLSAHEVGHTLGLVHNFASSVNDRASVMDYPHPYIKLTGEGSLNFREAYATGIGRWDKRAIMYGYQDFAAGEDEGEMLQHLLHETASQGLHYLSDQDARPFGGAHPQAHLWDNGQQAAAELQRMLELRAQALRQFGPDHLPAGRPLAELEGVLVPIYYGHRYQVEAAAKSLGGVYYQYAVRSDASYANRIVPPAEQSAALEALLLTLQAEQLLLPEAILQLIPPLPAGYRQSREHFKRRTQVGLDPLAAAEAAAEHTLRLMLYPARANRLVEFHARAPRLPGLDQVLARLVAATWQRDFASPYEAEVGRIVQYRVLQHLINLSQATAAAPQTRALAMQQVRALEYWINTQGAQRSESDWQAHYQQALHQIALFKEKPMEWKMAPATAMPDGSPIGMECLDWGSEE